jgi:hypothetical protein
VSLVQELLLQEGITPGALACVPEGIKCMSKHSKIAKWQLHG